LVNHRIGKLPTVVPGNTTIAPGVGMQIISGSLDGIPLLEIHDDIDHAAAEEFHATASAALDGRSRLVLDLTGCRYVDSGGLAVILALTKEIGPEGLLAIVGGNRNLVRLFHLVGLDAEPRVRLYADLAAAELHAAVDGR
jgi:anti-anti-sigma factor